MRNRNSRVLVTLLAAWTFAAIAPGAQSQPSPSTPPAPPPATRSVFGLWLARLVRAFHHSQREHLASANAKGNQNQVVLIGPKAGSILGDLSPTNTRFVRLSWDANGSTPPFTVHITSVTDDSEPILM